MDHMKISTGKWTKYKLMKQNEEIVGFLPETKLFSRNSLWEFLDRFKQIMFKPCFGFQGKGIIQIKSLGEGQYELQELREKIKLCSRDKVYYYLMNRSKDRGYHILQQKIQLSDINGSPFDLRVMVQRKRNSSSWKVTGKIVRVAVQGFFITNVAKELLTVEKAFDRSLLDHNSLGKLLSEIDRISVLTAIHLGINYSKYRKLGIDIGIDAQGKMWVIEANYNPNIRIFSYLEDKSMYKAIKEYLK